MKPRRLLSAARLSLPLASAIVALFAASHAHAVTLYWDLNGATANTAAAVTGAWNGTAGTNAFWNTAATGTGGAAQATNTNADDLVFSSGNLYTTGTVTASGTRVARSITFEDNIVITLAGAITVGGTGGTPGIFASAGKTTATTVSGALTLASACTYQNNDTGLVTLSGTQALAANVLNKSGTGPVTVSGVVSGKMAAASNAIVIANGLLTLSGANTFSGDIAVDGTSVFAMPGGTFTTTAPYGRAGATLYKQLFLTNGGTFRLTGGTFNDNAPDATNTAEGIIFNIGSGGGTFDIANGATLIIDDGATVLGTGLTASQLQGAGNLTKTGLGTFQTDDSTGYAGTITVTEGTIQPANANAFGANTAGTTIQSGAALNVNGIVMTNAEPLTINGAGLTASPVGALTNAATGSPTWVGPITLGSPSTIGVSNTGSMTLSAGATVATAGHTLTFRNTNTGRVFSDGVISGAGAVVMNSTGTGDWVPRGDHTYTGGTTHTAGAIAVDRDSIGTPGSPTSGPFGTGTLTFAGGQMRCGTGVDRTVGNAVTISANTTFYTAATEKSLTFTGPVTLSGATRTITADVGATVAGKSTILSGAIGDGGNALGLIKAGTGNLTLGGANTYTGGTTVNSGALILNGSLAPNTALTVSPTVAGGAAFMLGSGAANPLPTVSALTFGSATETTTLGFDLGANTAASDFITTAATATATGTVNIAVQALAGFGSSSTYNLINAAGGLDGADYVLTSAPGGFNYTLSKTGTLVQLGVTAATAGDRYWRGNINGSWSALSGSNTNWFNDAAGLTNAQTSPSAGETVNFSTVNALNSGGVITTTLDNNFTVKHLVFGSNPNGVNSVTIAGGTAPGGVRGVLAIAPTSSGDGIVVGSNAGAITISAPVLLGAAQTWSVDGTGANGSALTVSGELSGSGPLTINGLVTLSATGWSASTHSGSTTVPNGSILQGGAANSFSASSAVTIDPTGIVRLNGFSNRVASLAGTGTVQNNHATTAATLTVGDATDFTFPGTLQNGAVGTLGLTKAGTGIMTLSGTNTFTGATTITEGTIKQGVANVLPAGTALTINGTGVFDLNGADASVSTLGGVATGVVTDNAVGSGTSTLSITAAAGASNVIINDGATRDVALRVTNTNGNFLLTNGSNTFSGGIVLTHNVTGTRMSPGTITTGAYGTGPITIGESPSDKAGIFFATAGQTFTNPIIFNTALGTDRVGIRADAAVTLSGVITANLAPATFTSNNGTGGAFTLTNQITGSSGLVLDITSLSAAATSFIVTLNNTANPANNYQGDTVINFNPAAGKSATLAVAAADQIPNGTGAGNVIVNSNGTGVGRLRLMGVSETINGLSGSGVVESTSGTVTLTLGDNNATASHSGAINNTAGTLAVTKIGTGIQTLSGASTFAGALTVTGGLVAFPSSPATTGPLGNSTVVNLDGGGISYTAAGANTLNRTAAIGNSTGTVDVANASGTLTLAATSTGGDLIKTGPGTASLTGITELNSAANGAGVVVSNGTLQAGFGATDVATVTVGTTGNLNLSETTAETLTLEASAGALTLNGGAQVGFDLSGGSSDRITVGAGGTAVTSGTVTLNFFGTPTSGTTYTLLTADSGLNGATYALGAAPSGFNYQINVSSGAITLSVVAESPIYWRDGQVNGLWSTLGAAPANWTTDAGGAMDALSTPLAANAVIFSATGATTTSNVDAAFTVDSLRFSSSHTITGAGALTLAPASTSGGIRVLSGGLTATISAPLTIGAAQTWDVDPTGSLSISGNTAFNGNITKTNTGLLTLSGNNSGSGAITLAGGTLNLNSTTALGTGLFTIGAGTTLNTPSGAIALAANNAQVWNGDYTFTGANTLDLGTGAITLSNSLTVTTPGSGALTVGGSIGDSGNNRSLTKAGAGMLVLNGSNSYGGLTAINAGVLRITNGAGLGATTAGTIQSGSSALELDGTLAPITVGAEPLTINGGGVALPTPNLGALRNIAGDNTYGGTITMGIQSRINSDLGTLTLNNPTAVSATNLFLVVGGAGNTTISGAIAIGTGGVNKADGAGTLTLSGTNTYQGATTVTAGTLTLTSGGSITTAGNVLLNVNGAAVANLEGTYTSTGGGGVAINTGGILNTSGTVTISGPNNQAILIGTTAGSGTWNVTGGSVSVNYASNGWGIGNTGTGTLNVSAGSVTTAAADVFNVGHGAAGTGILTISGTGLVTVNAGSGAFSMGANATSTGTVNLDGGTLALGRNITKNATATSTFNFNGGLLRAGLTSATYMTGLTRANVRNGGAMIDTNGFNITVGQALLHSDNVLDNTIDGGLTKSGLGILTLSGANTYTGATLVSDGTLQLNGAAATGAPLTTSSMTVGTAGTLGFTAAAASTLDLSDKDMTLSGGTLAFDIGDAGVNDAINVNNFTLTANSKLSFTSIGAIGGSYTLVTSTNAISNSGSYTISGQVIGRVTLTPTVNANTITVSSTLYEGEWNQSGGGNWSVGNSGGPSAPNWNNYKPTVTGDAALFGASITAPSTVVVDTPHTVGYIRFDHSKAYTIGSNGSSFLTLNNGTNNAVVAVTTGSHVIAENVALLSNLDVLPATGTALTMSGGISGINKNLEVLGAGGVTISGAITTGTGTVTKDGAGALSLSGVNTYTGITTVKAGSLFVNGGSLAGATTVTGGSMTVNAGSLAGPSTVTGGSMFVTGGTVGSGTIALTVSSATDKPMLVLSGMGTASGRFLVGNAAGLSGAIYQTGGTANAAGNAGTDNFMGGNNAASSGGYGFYQLSGGNLNSTSYMSFGNNGGTGLFYQTGGAVNLSGTGWFQLGYGGTTGSNGVAYLAGGTFTAPSGQLQVLGYQTPAGARGELTIAGTDVTSLGTVNFGHGNSTGGTGVINLRSGSLQATNIVESNAAVTSVLNFNGGTFKSATGAGTMTGLNFGYVHSGGAVIDTSLSNFTIGQALLAPAGDGVATIPVTDAGSGYLGAPYVQITGGSSDATAVALMVDDGTGKGTYKVDSILVTNPGNIYASAPTVVLIGGSPVTGATLGTVTTAANVSGGLNKTGANTLTLTGVNTYTGATTVSLGTLALVGGSQASPITVNSGASLGFTVGLSTSSTSTVTFNAGSTVTITGIPTLPSYTLMTTTASFTGTPVLSAPVPGYELKVEGTALKLVSLGYASWAAVNGASTNLNDDHDKDGVPNGIEYFIGGPTGNTTGFTPLPGVVNNSGTLSITWTKGPGYAGAYGTDFLVETSATLSGAWTPQTATPTPGFTVTFPTAAEVKFTFPAGTTNFARLKVTGP